MSPAPQRSDPACVFCRIIGGAEPADVVLDDDVVVAILDHRPLFPGHVLVMPRELPGVTVSTVDIDAKAVMRWLPRFCEAAGCCALGSCTWGRCV